jgi:two-component system NtrC family sensor kinase
MNLLPRTLAQRLIVSLTLIVAILEGISGTLNVRMQERQLLDTMVLGADQLSRGIASSTWHAMLADNRDSAYQVMQTIAQKQGISRIQIFNKEGRVMFTTTPGAVSQVDKNAEACFLCHASQQPLIKVDVPSRARVFRAPDGGRRLAMVTPIYNEPSCSQAECHAHPETQNVLGVLDVALDLGPVDREVRALELRAVGSGVIHSILIALFIVFFTRAFFSLPVQRLIKGTREVSKMHLDRPVAEIGQGELGELARSFNTMREQLQHSLDEQARFTHTLETTVAERTEALKAAHHKLLQTDRLASLGQLSASVAHEINNPLSGVLNLGMLVQRIVKDDGIPPGRVPEVKKYLGQIVNETSRAGRIVSDLLTFSRRSKPQRVSVDVNGIVRSTLSLVGHKLKLMNVEAVEELASDLPLVHCDASQVQQVVMNLVMNGAEATRPKGEGTVCVRTGPGPRAGTIALEVADNGEGITKENLGKLYQPFFTTKEEGKGVGLGLAVVYGIVQAHGGEIEVASSPGAGTSFRVVLPVAAAEDAGNGSDNGVVVVGTA